MHQVPLFLELFARFPKLGGLFGLIITIVFAFVGIMTWQELQGLPDKPERLSLSQAASRLNVDEKIWVEIEGIKWDCQNIVYTQVDRNTDTEVVFTDETLSVLGVAQFSSRMSCEDITRAQVSGVLSRMGDKFYTLLPERGFNLTAYRDADSQLFLCTFCGRDNSVLGLIISGAMVALGLAMYPLCLALQKRFKNARIDKS